MKQVRRTHTLSFLLLLQTKSPATLKEAQHQKCQKSDVRGSEVLGATVCHRQTACSPSRAHKKRLGRIRPMRGAHPAAQAGLCMSAPAIQPCPSPGAQRAQTEMPQLSAFACSRTGSVTREHQLTSRISKKGSIKALWVRISFCIKHVPLALFILPSLPSRSLESQ